MADNKTDASTAPLSDVPVHPTKGGLSAKPITASQPAGAEPRLDTLFHRTLSFIERLAILLHGPSPNKGREAIAEWPAA